MSLSLSPAYGSTYRRLLEGVAATPKIHPPETSLFWPKVGRRYDGELLLVGRAVNGWMDRWDVNAPTDLDALVAAARATAEATVDDCPMGWVVERWKSGDGDYDTSRSQFWATTRDVVTDEHPEWESDWPSHLVWSNLAKVSRWTKGNPSGRLRRAQLDVAAEALALEVAELAPQRVMVLAGRDWFGPFADRLGLDMEWRQGLVEGVAEDGLRRWVIAVHPMTRSPSAVAQAVLEAFRVP